MASDLKAFELKADVRDGFVGGSFALGPTGETFDLAAELARHGDVIVTDDPLVVASLSDHEFFKAATVPPSIRDEYDQLLADEGKPAASAYLRADGGEPAEVVEPDDVTDAGDGLEQGLIVNIDSVKRERLDEIAEAELDDYDPDDFATKADVAAAINSKRESQGA